MSDINYPFALLPFHRLSLGEKQMVLARYVRTLREEHGDLSVRLEDYIVGEEKWPPYEFRNGRAC